MVKKILWAMVILAAFITADMAKAQEKVVIGYQGVYNPWKVAIANGDFEKATRRKIEWRKFNSGAAVITAMASGQVHIAMAGSSPIAAGVSRGLDMELFWIVEDIASAEAFVVRDGSGIIAPQDLKGKRIGVPFASTTHFHLLFALEQFGLTVRDVTVLNMQPNEIAAAWERGDIDGAFVWDPALGRIKKNGKVLLTSGQLSSWGKATFDGMVANKTWADKNRSFMVEFVHTIAKADQAYRKNVAKWTPKSKEVKAIIELVGGSPEDVPGVLALYGFLTLKEQASKNWLGGGADGGAARALKFTSEFLKNEKKIPSLLPDYGVAVNSRWVDTALRR